MNNNKIKTIDAKIIVYVVLSMLVFAVYISLFTDYRYFLLSLTAGANEEKALRQNKHFTGKACYKGELKDHTRLPGNTENNYNGIRITRYKNGLKEGREKVYNTHERGGYFNLGNQTLLHSISHYHNGELHGKKTIHYPGGDIAIEANYENGKLHGLYQEIRFPERIMYFKMEPDEEYPNYAYYHPGKRIPLKKEVQYANGEIDGFYRTYDDAGDTMNDYTMVNGSIVNGMRGISVVRMRADVYGFWTDDDRIDQFTANEDSITNGLRRLVSEQGDKILSIREYYSNGEITAQIAYSNNIYEFSPTSLLGSLFYENGEVTDYAEYDYYRTDSGVRKNYYTLRKKRINGEMIEVFNRKAGINRLKEFDLDN
jgi:antitoxin component YwqK of YwqJK toxin-antitoxin module